MSFSGFTKEEYEIYVDLDKRIRLHSKIYQSDPYVSAPVGLNYESRGHDWTIEFFGFKITQFLYENTGIDPYISMVSEIINNTELLEKFKTLEKRFANLEKLEL